MIAIKEAVQAAISSVLELYKGAADIRLEEAEKEGPAWSVVLSFTPYDATDPLASVMKSSKRLYKRIEVAGDTGELIALKVWGPQ